MTTFILTCVNEDHLVIDVKAYKTLAEAHAAMEEQFNKEREAFLEDFEELIEDDIQECSAHLVAGEEPLLYYWLIAEVTVG